MNLFTDDIHELIFSSRGRLTIPQFCSSIFKLMILSLPFHFLLLLVKAVFGLIWLQFIAAIPLAFIFAYALYNISVKRYHDFGQSHHEILYFIFFTFLLLSTSKLINTITSYDFFGIQSGVSYINLIEYSLFTIIFLFGLKVSFKLILKPGDMGPNLYGDQPGFPVKPISQEQK